MRLEKYDSELLKQQVKDIAGKYLALSAYAIFFFGSRVSGAGDARSDIDIGIEGAEQVPLTAMRSIREDIELLPILYKVDVVDFSQTSETFRDVSKQHIEYINKPAVSNV